MSNQRALRGPRADGTVHVVLVPGFWLGGWAWDDVVPTLRDAALEPHPVTLPGLAGPDDDRVGITLDDHVRTVTELVDTLDGDVVLVGHSGAAAVIQGAVDRRPGRIRRAVYVDAGPVRDGVALREATDGSGGPGDGSADLPLPSWDELEAVGDSIVGLDDAALERFRRLAVPQPIGVATTPLRLTDPRRLTVPVTVICTSLTVQTLRQLVAAGQFPTELPDVTDVDYVDLPTGHWPMFSRPRDLAEVIVHAAVT